MGARVLAAVVFQQAELRWAAVAIVGAGIALVWLGYRRSPLAGPRKWLAMGCKVSAVLLLAMLLLDPQRVKEVPRQGANEVVIVADNGAGMKVAEKKGEPSRGERMKAALGTMAKPPAWIDSLAKSFRVRMLTADERVRGVEDFSVMKLDGQQSAICSAVKPLSMREAASTTAAVIVLTDGNATDAEAWSGIAKDKAAPVFPVVVGSDEIGSDIGITEASGSVSAFEDSPLTVTAKVRVAGTAEQEVWLGILDEAGKVVASEKRKLGKGEAEPVFRLKVAAVKPGVSFFRTLVLKSGLDGKLANDEWRKLADEATAENNERWIAVDRGSGPYRVLYIAGRPNWEYKFMRRALAADTEVQMPSMIRIAKREPKFEWRGRAGETTNPLFRGFKAEAGEEAQRYDQPVWIRLETKDKKELADGFPKAAEDLFAEYRAIIIDDLESGAFTQEQMNLIERFVSQRGGALLMLGGQECFQAGGYEHTPVGRMLPVYLDRIGQGPPVEDGRFNLTREGWLEAWTRLRPKQEEDEARLAAMPAFFSLNQAVSIKPGASILATVSDTGQKAHPALVVQRFGEGRTAALAVGDLWRWGMKDAEQHADMDKAWRQLMRWLVADVPDRIVLEPQVSKDSGQAVAKLQARVRDGAFRAVDDAAVKFVVSLPGGKKTDVFAEPSVKEAGLFEAEFFPRESGAYRVAAEVKNGKGEPLGERHSGWTHEPMSDELRNIGVNRPLLDRMAADTGGKVIELSDLGSLPELLAGLDVPVKQRMAEPLWHSPWLFAVILGLLAAEWILRRRSGWI